jgi:serine protease Do
MRKNSWRIAGCLALAAAGAGCAGPRGGADGRALFEAMQQTVAGAGDRVEPGLVLVKVRKEKPKAEETGIRITYGGPGGGSEAPPLVGLVLTPQGHVLVPETIKPDSDDRIEAWIGDEEFVARPIKSDDALGMTILKLDSDKTFTPVSLGTGADLAVGEWAVVRVPSGEETDFQKFTSLLTCRGEVAGRYRRFLLSGLPREARGAPVVNLAGEVAGLAGSGDAVAVSDIADDLRVFLAGATGVLSPEEEEKQKGWLGAMLEPINKEYAEAKRLPESALWVLHADREGPAAAAGLKAGDLVVALNGAPLRFSGVRARDYFLKTLRPQAGQPFAVTVRRDGQAVECKGTLAKRPEPITLHAEDVGVTVANITDSDYVTLNLFSREGVRVTEVDRGSAAATGSSFGRTLLQKDDVVIELGGQPTPNIETFGRVLEAVRRDHPPAVLVRYWRGPVAGYEGLNLRIGERMNGGGS